MPASSISKVNAAIAVSAHTTAMPNSPTSTEPIVSFRKEPTNRVSTAAQVAAPLPPASTTFEDNRTPMQPGKLSRQSSPFSPVGVFESPADHLDAIGDPPQPGREDVQ
jgi:hypothetical protein